MATNTGFSFLLLLPLLFSLFIPPSALLVKWDVTLIKQVCKKTVASVACLECLLSDPRSNETDVRGLGQVAMDCTYVEVVGRPHYIGTVAAQSTNEEFKLRLEEFVHSTMKAATSELEEVIRMWFFREYQ